MATAISSADGAVQFIFNGGVYYFSSVDSDEWFGPYFDWLTATDAAGLDPVDVRQLATVDLVDVDLSDWIHRSSTGQ